MQMVQSWGRGENREETEDWGGQDTPMSALPLSRGQTLNAPKSSRPPPLWPPSVKGRGHPQVLNSGAWQGKRWLPHTPSRHIQGLTIENKA